MGFRELFSRNLCPEIKKGNRKHIVVVASGYFNPLHIGHIWYLRESKKLGDKLIVIVCNDKQVKIKNSVPFMNEKERMEIIASLKWIDEAVLSIDQDETVCKTLEMIKPDIYTKGGDRTPDNMPKAEIDTCKKLGTKIVYGVGGKKIQSSSRLIELCQLYPSSRRVSEKKD